jgi:hypothetical protein
MEDTMTVNKVYANARRALVTLLSLTLCVFGAFNTGSTLAAKKPQNPNTGVAKSGNQQVGQLIATGLVSVNEKKAITGTAVFSDSRIAVECSKGSRAIVDLGKLGRIELIEGSKMALRFTDGMISGELREGKAVVNSPAGVKVAINTPKGLFSADGQDAAVTQCIAQETQCVAVTTACATCAPPQRIPSVFGGRALAGILGGIGAGVGVAAAVSGGEEQNASLMLLPR